MIHRLQAAMMMLYKKLSAYVMMLSVITEIRNNPTPDVAGSGFTQIQCRFVYYAFQYIIQCR